MAQNEPLHIDAGATYSRQFTYAKDDGTPYSSDFNCKVVIRDLNGNKVIDITPTFSRNTGDISFTLSAAQTSSLTQPRYRWGMELIGNTETIRLLQGRVSVSPEVVS
jgi:hypothetical protein